MVEVAAVVVSARSVSGMVLAERFEDPENARTIYLMAGGLTLLAVLLGVGTYLWWRTSKVEHPSLGPLEVMGTRRWSKGDYASRQRRLEAARPADRLQAQGDDTAAGGVAEPVDLGAIANEVPPSFDDLFDDALLSALAAVANGQSAEPAASPAEGVEHLDAAPVEPIDERPRAPIDPLLRSPAGE